MPEVLLEGGEVEEDALHLEGGHLVADRLRRFRNLFLHDPPDRFEDLANPWRQRREIGIDRCRRWFLAHR
jgi:hypothetical protein